MRYLITALASSHHAAQAQLRRAEADTDLPPLTRRWPRIARYALAGSSPLGAVRPSRTRVSSRAAAR